MLEIIQSSGRQAVACDDYTITHAYNGRDTVSFSLSRRDPAVLLLRERTRVYETTGGQTYLVSGIDAGQDEVDYVLQKDLTDWEKRAYPGYTNGTREATAEATIRGVLPTGWTLNCSETDTLAAYISLQGPTALDVVEHCREVFGCTVTYDNEEKTATLHFPARKAMGPAFLAETANLREVPEYKSRAGGVVTRLYAQGADGMNFASINGGKTYVECFDSTDEVIAGFWRDDRYTVPEHLLQAAREKVKTLSCPERAWSLRAADLYGADPSAWPGMKMQLYDVVILVDPSLGQKMEVQITEFQECPHHPEKNEITVETRDSTIRSLSAAIRAGHLKSGQYQGLSISVDQVKRDLGVTNDTVENVRLTADGAVFALQQIANGTYTGGTFIDGTRLYSPEIYAQVVKLVNSAGGSIPTLSFYPRNGSNPLLTLSASGSSSAGYSARVYSRSDLILQAANAVVLKGTSTAGPSGYTGVTVEGNADIYGDLSLSGTAMADFVSARGKSGSWNYRKWNGGHVELWGTLAVRASSSTAVGNGYISDELSVTLPFAVTGGCMTGSAGGSCYITSPSVSGTTLKFYLIRPAPIYTTTDILVRAVVMGNWK